MALNETTKNSIAFKKSISKDHRNTDNAWYEETDGGGFNIHADDIWADPIPSTPSAFTTLIIKVYKDSADGALKLSHDATVPNERGWYAEVGSRLRGFVPPKYGQAYTVRVFEDNGTGLAKGNEIFTTNNSDWFFDYETGYLSFQDSHSFQTPIWIEGYYYIGQVVTNKFGTGSGGPEPLSGAGSPVGLVTGELGQLYLDTTSSLWFVCDSDGSTVWSIT